MGKISPKIEESNVRDEPPMVILSRPFFGLIACPSVAKVFAQNIF